MFIIETVGCGSSTSATTHKPRNVLWGCVEVGVVALHDCPAKDQPHKASPGFFFGQSVRNGRADNGPVSGSFHEKTGQRDTSAASRANCVRGIAEVRVHVASELSKARIDESHPLGECGESRYFDARH